MVDKRSLRSSKKDAAEPPPEGDKPKPTRTRSARGKKAAAAKTNDTQAQNAANEDHTVSATPSQSAQSDDVVMQTDPQAPTTGKASEDVEMENAGEETNKQDNVPNEDLATSPVTSTLSFSLPLLFEFLVHMGYLVIKQNLQLLERAVSTSDPRFAYRVLKISNLRKRLSAELLVQVVREVYPPDHPSVPILLSLLDKVRISSPSPPPLTYFQRLTGRGLIVNGS